MEIDMEIAHLSFFNYHHQIIISVPLSGFSLDASEQLRVETERDFKTLISLILSKPKTFLNSSHDL
jgi:hypothetical protein